MATILGNGSVFQPITMYPKGQYIDATDVNTFSCIIRGSKITEVVLTINDGTTDIYTNTLTQNLCNDDVCSFTIPANTLTNTKTYYWYLVLSNKDNTNFTVMSLQSEICEFYTLAKPVISIDSVSAVASSKYILTGSYSQTNYIPIAWYQWTLTDNYGNVVKSDIVANSERIQFPYESFQNGLTYTAQLVAEGINKVQVSAIPITFSVLYSSFSSPVSLIAYSDNSIDAVRLSWSGTPSSGVTGWNIQRKETGYNNMVNLAHISVSQMSYIDYSACSNGHSYVYYVFPETQTSTGIPTVSNTITPNWITASLTDPTLGKVYIFQMDIESGDISNKTDRTEYDTFTKYPKISKGNRDYYEGNLKCSFGKVTCDGQYICSPADIEEMRKVINNINKKYLKTKNGELYIVDAYNLKKTWDERVGVDKATISFDWTEVDDNIYRGVVYQNTSGNIYWNFL